MKKISIFLSLFLIACSSKPAEKPTEHKVEVTKTIEYKQFDLKDAYIIDTVIDRKVFNNFLKNFKRIRVLVLNSPGGLLEESKTMAQLIRRQRITTIVPANGTCGSTCALLFQAGEQRLIDPTAQLFYHGMRYSKRYMKSYMDECPVYTTECEDRFEFMKIYIVKLTLEYYFLLEYYGASKEIFNNLKKQTVDPNWLVDGNLTGKKNMYISAEEALKYKAATDIVLTQK